MPDDEPQGMAIYAGKGDVGLWREVMCQTLLFWARRMEFVSKCG